MKRKHAWSAALLMAVVGLMLLACSSDDVAGNGDTDFSEFPDDGDLETDDWTPMDGDEDADMDTEPDGEQPPGDEDTTDGDADPDLDAEPEPELEPEPDMEPEAEPEPEPEMEPEMEEESEPPVTCQATDDPLDFVSLLAFPELRGSAYAYEGEISDACQADGFLVAGAKGMEVSFTLSFRSLDRPLVGRLLITDVAGTSGRREPVVLFDETMSFPLAPVNATFTLPYSGEFLVAVSGKDLESTGLYGFEAQCVSNCTRRFTRHPVVLMHGMAGWDTTLGFYNYFLGVEDDLVERGYNVHVTEVAMFNDSIYRANEIESQLMDILTETGARKIDIIAHSQGGIDARHFISGMGHPDDVAVVAMVATPNRGVILGDMVLGTVQGVSREVIASIVDFFGNLLDGSDSDIEAALAQISVEQMEEHFNPEHPDVPGVEYWSWAGLTCGMLDFSCRGDHGGEWVNPAMSLTFGLINMEGEDHIGYGPNDGMVPLNSARYGEFMGTVNADHADEIGQLKTGDFDHKAFYRDIADLIYVRGF